MVARCRRSPTLSHYATCLPDAAQQRAEVADRGRGDDRGRTRPRSAGPTPAFPNTNPTNSGGLSSGKSESALALLPKIWLRRRGGILRLPAECLQPTAPPAVLRLGRLQLSSTEREDLKPCSYVRVGQGLMFRASASFPDQHRRHCLRQSCDPPVSTCTDCVAGFLSTTRGVKSESRRGC